MATVSKRKWTHKGASKEAWMVRYTDLLGVRRMKTFTTKKLADQYRIKTEGELQTLRHIAPNASAPVKAVCRLYLIEQDQKLRDGMIGRGRRDQIVRIMRRYVEPILGHKLFSELTSFDIEHWFTTLSEGGRLAPSSRKVYLRELKTLEEFAIRKGFTAKTPAASFKINRKAHTAKPIATFTVEQVGAILAAAEVRLPVCNIKMHALMRCAVHVAAFLGLRKGEIFALQVRDVDLQARVLHIRHNLLPSGELKGPKTAAGVRDVLMPPHVAILLEGYREKHVGSDPDDFFFTSTAGSHVNINSTIHNLWKRLLIQARVCKEGDDLYHFHALRHFAASWMIENQLAGTNVAKMLGHEKFDVTLQVYAHPVLGIEHHRPALDGMAQRLIDMISPPQSDTTDANLLK